MHTMWRGSPFSYETLRRFNTSRTQPELNVCRTTSWASY
jgi:hypothetical protein